MNTIKPQTNTKGSKREVDGPRDAEIAQALANLDRLLAGVRK